MNDNFFYDIDEILRALDHYQGDPFFSQQYAALLQEQISKGLDLLLKKDIPSKSMLFRYLILLYIKKQYRARIFHLGQAAHLLIWMNDHYTKAQLHHCEKLVQDTCHMIESTHESLDRWKNPALCSYAIRQIEQHYQKICLHDLSSALKINPSYLSRVLSQNLQVTFLDLLHTKRIFVALEYFSNSKKLPQLEYLATDLGYSSAHYFYCVFKRYVGLTPSEVWHLMSA